VDYQQATHHCAANDLCLKSIPSPENSGSAGYGCLFDWHDHDQGLPWMSPTDARFSSFLLQKGDNLPSTKHRKSG
jgi:hypothetical protein